MKSTKRNPRWWQLYVGLPVLVSLFWPEMQLPLTATENVIAQLGILCLIFGFLQLWLHANRSALMRLEEEDGTWEMKVYQTPPADLHLPENLEAHRSQRPLLQIPAAGVKGVLSDTFEWETPEEDSSVFAEQGVVRQKD